MKIASALPTIAKLLLLWLLTLSSLAVWYVFYVAYILPFVAAHPDFRPGRELPAVLPWVMDVAISWQANGSVWTIAALLVSASIIAERVSRASWSHRTSRLVRVIPSVYGVALLVVSATFLYVVHTINAQL